MSLAPSPHAVSNPMVPLWVITVIIVVVALPSTNTAFDAWANAVAVSSALVGGRSFQLKPLSLCLADRWHPVQQRSAATAVTTAAQ